MVDIKKERWEKLCLEMQKKVQSRLDLSRELTDEDVLQLIDEEILHRNEQRFLFLEEKLRLRRELFHTIRKLDILQELVEDPEITEIMVNGPKEIFVEKNGRLYRWQKTFASEQKLEDVVQRMVNFSNRSVSRARPIADARLEDGSRVNIVLAPVAVHGPVVTIRRFPEKPVGFAQLLMWEAISEEAVQFLQELVAAGYNIFVSGGTGSGKTTFLNALSAFIPVGERVITIEDNAELQLVTVENLVTLEARNANLEGECEITIRDLMRTALRMRPDRIIVGEVRGAEALDMIQAMSTGHDGSLSTGHANSSKDMLSRLETMILMGEMGLPLSAVRRQIVSGLDLIVHLGRLRDGSRKVLEISEIDGLQEGEIVLHTLFSFEEDTTQEKQAEVKGTLLRKGELLHTEKLRAAGVRGCLYGC